MKQDEKLEKLTERVDAMAQSAELLAGMQVETERRFTDLVDLVNRIGVATENLIGITYNHEQRLQKIEG